MFGRNNHKWDMYDDSHYERCHRYGYIKKMYFKLKYLYRDDLQSSVWNSIVTELMRVDTNNKRKKKEAKKQQLISEILATQTIQSIFNDDYDTLNKLDMKRLKKLHKARCKKNKSLQKPRSVKQKMNDLRRSIALYDEQTTLLKSYLQADTLRQYLQLRPGKLNMKYLTKLLSKQREKETYKAIIDLISQQHKFTQEELQPIVDHCNIKLKELATLQPS